MRSSRRIKTKKGDKSLIEAESDFAISRCVTSTPVSCITSDENCEISSTNTMKRKANAKLWTNAKKIKNQNMSNNLSSDSTNQRYQPFRVRDNEMNSLRASNNELKLSGFKPIIIHPQFETINSSELQTIDVSDASSEDENVMIVEDSPTNIQQPVIILQRMTSAYVENMINGNVNGPPINYNSWQWQPKVKLTKLTESDLRNVNRSKKVRSWTNQIDPIEFDKDESFIRELSPQTATERFEKVKFLKFNQVYNNN